MHGRVSDGPVLLLRISEEEHATIQEVLALVPHMDQAIVGYWTVGGKTENTR